MTLLTASEKVALLAVDKAAARAAEEAAVTRAEVKEQELLAQELRDVGEMIKDSRSVSIICMYKLRVATIKALVEAGWTVARSKMVFRGRRVWEIKPKDATT